MFSLETKGAVVFHNVPSSTEQAIHRYKVREVFLHIDSNLVHTREFLLLEEILCG